MNPHQLTRRTFLHSSTAIGALVAICRTSPVEAARFSAPAPAPLLANRAPLAPQPFQLLPTGAVKPAGWLRDQMLIQARGLGGRLDETWRDVGPNSGWLGGTGESWERGPYFVDGLLPLAWQLDDPALKAKAQRFIDWTLASAQPSGMFGPRSNDDWWPRMVMLKVLTQYHELTGDARVIPLMTDYFVHQLGAMPARPLRDWGRFRWQDQVATVIWLYNRTGDARLLTLARLLKRQGYDWQALFADYPYREKVTKASIGLDRPDVPGQVSEGLKAPALSVHGVNNAQALKASPVWSVVSGKPEDRDAVHRQLAALDRFHGLPIGMFAADEHLAGRSPSQGVELCAVVETMYSLEHALAITGDAALGDRIEQIAFNALPATFTDDMWAHQYDQQPNQVECTRAKGPWTTNGEESNLFGLEPHFGCCTANFHQGWPKLTSSLWMASADDGLAAAVYAPCEVTTAVRGVPVKVREQTEYPFRDTVTIMIDPAHPTRFPLRLRIPAWVDGASVRINGEAQPAPRPGGFALVERTWAAGDRVEIAFDVAPRAVTGFNDSTSFHLGPLVFALPLEEQWEKWRQRGLTADWEVKRTGDWAYGVAADASLRRVRQPIGKVPFSRLSPPVVLETEMRPIGNWQITDGAADPVPLRPQASGPPQRVVLMPYGAPKLRIAAFPTLHA